MRSNCLEEVVNKCVEKNEACIIAGDLNFRLDGCKIVNTLRLERWFFPPSFVYFFFWCIRREGDEIEVKKVKMTALKEFQEKKNWEDLRIFDNELKWFNKDRNTKLFEQGKFRFFPVIFLFPSLIMFNRHSLPSVLCLQGERRI